MALAESPRRVRVVLADDTAEIRMLLRIGLRLDGRFEVVGEAGDGETAVRLCGELQPDVALLDLAMPVMDGLQAIPLIQRCSPGTRIVVLSAFSSNQMESDAVTAGADAYVEKGASNDELVDVIASLAGESQPAVRSPLVHLPDEMERRTETGAAARSRAGSDDVAVDGALDVILDALRHELRTPITLASGFADLLAQAVDAGDTAAIYERLEDVQRNLGLADRLVTLLADVRAIDADGLEIETSQLDLAQVAHRLAADVAAVAGEHRIVVAAPQPVLVVADEARVAQVVINLVSNAAKFAPAGSDIDLTVASRRGFGELAVRDRGPGIAPEDEATVFARFGRLDRDRFVHGMGIGLFLARGIAQALGGDLVLQRPEDGGSRFVLRVPVAT